MLTPTQRRLYDVDSLVHTAGRHPKEAEARANKSRRAAAASTSGDRDAASLERIYLYCRVSSSKQRLVELHPGVPDSHVIEDVGSGLNWRRPGRRKVLRLARQGRLGMLVVAHRDQLSRLAFDLIEHVLELDGARVVVEHDPRASVRETDELGEDLLSIIHVFSCREYGRRAERERANNDHENPGQEESKDGSEGQAQDQVTAGQGGRLPGALLPAAH